MNPAPPPRCLLVLGSNITPERHLPEAVARLRAQFPVESMSAVYISPAVGAPGTPDFHNQAILFRSGESPDALRTAFRTIEADLGRVRGEDPNAPRTIDIDLIACFDRDDVALDDPPVDPDLSRYHHLAHPAAEVLPLAKLGADGPALTDLARQLGAAPDGFRRIPAHAS